MSKKSCKVFHVEGSPTVVRSFIENARGSFGSVAFYTQSGRLRHMTFQRGNDAAYCRNTERGQRASETFARNNPNMIRLRDVNVQRRGDPRDPGWRTVSLDAVASVRIDGVTIRFA